MAGGGGQQGAAAPAQGQSAAQPQSGGMPQQQPNVSPQTIQDVQNLIQQYQSAQMGGGARGFALGGGLNVGGVNPQGAMSAGAFSPQGQTNMMKPMPFPSGGPYGGINPQGQGDMQLTPPQQAAIAYNANPQGQPMPQGFGPAVMQAQPEVMSAGAFSPQGPMGGTPQMPQGGGPDMSGTTVGGGFGFDRSGSDAGVGGRPTTPQSPLGSMGSLIPSMQKGVQVQGNPTAMRYKRRTR